MFNFWHVPPILVKAGHPCILPSCPGYDFVNKSTRIDGSLDIKSVAKDKEYFQNIRNTLSQPGIAQSTINSFLF